MRVLEMVVYRPACCPYQITSYQTFFGSVQLYRRLGMLNAGFLKVYNIYVKLNNKHFHFIRKFNPKKQTFFNTETIRQWLTNQISSELL